MKRLIAFALAISLIPAMALPASAGFTVSEPELVTDLNIGTASGTYGYRDYAQGESDYAVLGGYAYFPAASSKTKSSLHRLSPDEQLQEVLISGQPISFPRNLTPIDSSTMALSVISNGFRRFAIYDATANTLDIFSNTFIPDSWYSLSDGPIFAVHNGNVYFASYAIDTGEELWRFDSATEQVSLLADMNPTQGSKPRELTVGDDHLFFSYYDQNDGRMLAYIDLNDLDSGADLADSSTRLWLNQDGLSWSDALGGLVYQDGEYLSDNYLKVLRIDPDSGSPVISDLTYWDGSAKQKVLADSGYSQFSRPIYSGNFVFLSENNNREYIYRYEVVSDPTQGDLSSPVVIEAQGSARLRNVVLFDTAANPALFYQEYTGGVWRSYTVPDALEPTPGTAVEATTIDGASLALTIQGGKYKLNNTLYFSASVSGKAALLEHASNFASLSKVTDFGSNVTGDGVNDLLGYLGNDLVFWGDDGVYLMNKDKMMSRAFSANFRSFDIAIGDTALFVRDPDELTTPLQVYNNGQLSNGIPISGGATIVNDGAWWTIAAVGDTAYITDSDWGNNRTHVYSYELGQDTELQPVTFADVPRRSSEFYASTGLTNNVYVVYEPYDDGSWFAVVDGDTIVESEIPSGYDVRAIFEAGEGLYALTDDFSGVPVIFDLGWDGTALDVSIAASMDDLDSDAIIRPIGYSGDTAYFSTNDGDLDYVQYGVWTFNAAHGVGVIAESSHLEVLRDPGIVELKGQPCFLANDYGLPDGADVDMVYYKFRQSGLYCLEADALKELYSGSYDGNYPVEVINGGSGAYVVMLTSAIGEELYELGITYTATTPTSPQSSGSTSSGGSSPSVSADKSVKVGVGAKSLVVKISGASVVGFKLDDAPLFFRKMDESDYEVMLPDFLASAGAAKQLEVQLVTGIMLIDLEFEDGATKPTSSETRAGTKRLDSEQAKIYAFNVVGAGKVTIEFNGQEIAWVRAVDESDPKLRSSASGPYLVRTVDLDPGKNVIEVFVDGERIRRTAYTATAG